jgi:hypothetical protein
MRRPVLDRATCQEAASFSLPGFPRHLVTKPAKIHKATDRRLCTRRSLNEINTAGLRHPESVRDRHNTKPLSPLSNYPNLERPNPAVYANDGRPNLTNFSKSGAKRSHRRLVLQYVNEIFAAGRQQITARFRIWSDAAHACLIRRMVCVLKWKTTVMRRVAVAVVDG